jgi:predicted HTH domain antitoxin
MYQVTWSIPEETATALKITPDQLAAEVLLAAAVKLYELKRLSSGAAANLVGLSRPAFLEKLADYNVDTFCLSEAELIEDLADA